MKPLEEVATFQRGFDITKREIVSGSHPVIFSSGIGGRHSVCKVNGPGVVVGRKGSLGTAYFSEEDFWPTDTTLWVKDFHGNNPLFVYFLVKTMHFEQYDVGAANPTLNRNHIHTIPVNVPPLPTQKKIAEILSGYDELIENNRRRIQILEEMAQTIYREWFVNFKFPGHENKKLVDSKLGKIPEGWEAKSLGELVEIKKGKNITKATIRPGDVPVVAGGLTPAYYHDTSNTEQPVVTVSASGANSGFVNLYHIDVWASDCSFVDSVATPYVCYFYLWLKCRQTEVTRLQRGAAQPHVYPKDLMRLEALDVPTQIMEMFNENISPLFPLMASLTKKNENLRATRDLLLPKLISGEIEV